MCKTNEKKLLNVLFEFRSFEIEKDTEIRKIAFAREDELTNLLKQTIKNKLKLKEVLDKLNTFEMAVMEHEYEKIKEFYEYGYHDASKLNKESMTLNLSKIENKGDDSFIDEIYETRLSKLAVLSDEDKEYVEETFDENDIMKILPRLSKDEVKNLLEYLDNRLDNVYSKMDYFCQKYYKSGFKDGVKLICECK